MTAEQMPRLAHPVASNILWIPALRCQVCVNLVLRSSSKYKLDSKTCKRHALAFMYDHL